MEVIFSGFKSFAILTVANFANINSNKYFCPVGYAVSDKLGNLFVFYVHCFQLYSYVKPPVAATMVN